MLYMAEKGSTTSVNTENYKHARSLKHNNRQKIQHQTSMGHHNIAKLVLPYTCVRPQLDQMLTAIWHTW